MPRDLSQDRHKILKYFRCSFSEREAQRLTNIIIEDESITDFQTRIRRMIALRKQNKLSQAELDSLTRLGPKGDFRRKYKLDGSGL